jgi:hypothetical protein
LPAPIVWSFANLSPPRRKRVPPAPYSIFNFENRSDCSRQNFASREKSNACGYKPPARSSLNHIGLIGRLLTPLPIRAMIRAPRRAASTRRAGTCHNAPAGARHDRRNQQQKTAGRWWPCRGVILARMAKMQAERDRVRRRGTQLLPKCRWKQRPHTVGYCCPFTTTPPQHDPGTCRRRARRLAARPSTLRRPQGSSFPILTPTISGARHFGQMIGSVLRSKNFASQLLQRRLVPSSGFVTSSIPSLDGKLGIDPSAEGDTLQN